MAPEPHLQRIEEVVPEPTHTTPQIVDEATMKAARRSSVVDNWFLAVMIFAIAAFAGALALFVFVPAMRTVLG